MKKVKPKVKNVMMLKDASRKVDVEVQEGSRKVTRHYVAGSEYELEDEIADSLLKSKEAEEVTDGVQDRGRETPSKNNDSEADKSK